VIERRALLDIALTAAEAAGAIIRDRARDAGGIAWHLKSHSDFVTEVDTAAERAIRDVILSRRPGAVVASIIILVLILFLVLLPNLARRRYSFRA